MDKLFGSLKGILKRQSVTIDNNVFRLHYKVTLPILVAFSLVVTGRQYLGDPIECISKDDIPNKVLQTFCWVHSTFSVESAWFKEVGKEIPYPGVDKYVEGDNRVYHAYYQWVCFVLFLQAILFYIPRYFWKSMESGRIKCMVQGLNSPILEQGKKDANINILANYIVATFNNNESYLYLYCASEILNVINVIGQMYLMDAFLGGSFSSYGAQVIKFTEYDWPLRYDPMIHVFPRMAKCTFHRYGSSGDVQRHDAMCILPINIMNEKIYVFLWFWFVIMAILSCVALAYRIILFLSHEARVRSLRPRASLVKEEHIEIIVRKCQVGDWFLIHLLAKNMNPIAFKDFMAELSRQLEGKIYDNNSTDA